MNTSKSGQIYKPDAETLQPEEFVRYIRANTRYFISGNRLYVWITEKRCFECIPKAKALTWMDSLIDPAYHGKVRSSALEGTYKMLLRDSSHSKNLVSC